MTPFEELLIMLVFAHLVGDFIFQRTEWVIQRQEKRWASPELYLHGLFHAVLYELVFWYHSVLEFWYLGIILGLVQAIGLCTSGSVPHVVNMLFFLRTDAR